MAVRPIVGAIISRRCFCLILPETQSTWWDYQSFISPHKFNTLDHNLTKSTETQQQKHVPQQWGRIISKSNCIIRFHNLHLKPANLGKIPFSNYYSLAQKSYPSWLMTRISHSQISLDSPPQTPQKNPPSTHHHLPPLPFNLPSGKLT